MTNTQEILQAPSLKIFSVQEIYRTANQLLDSYQQKQDPQVKADFNKLTDHLKAELSGKEAYPLAVLMECYMLNIESNHANWNSVSRHKQLSLLSTLYTDFEGRVPPAIWNQICIDYATGLRNTGRAFESIQILENLTKMPDDPSYHRKKPEIGWTLVFMARYLQEPSDKGICLYTARNHLKDYIQGDPNESLRPLYTHYLEMADSLYGQLGIKDVTITPMGNPFKGKEKRYRDWCKTEQLLLNVSNDIDKATAIPVDTFNYWHSDAQDMRGRALEHFFNSMTQEFLALRSLLYETAKHDPSNPHFGDAPFHQPDSLYVYSARNEYLKSVYRMAYSLFDKIAYFLKQYFQLEMPNSKATLQYIWFIDENPRKPLKPVFRNSQKDALKALYWLSRELYGYEREGEAASFFKKAGHIRNMLEHSYVQITQEKELFASQESGIRLDFSSFKSQIDDFQSHHLSQDELEQLTHALAKSARNALLYLRFVLDLDHQREESEG